MAITHSQANPKLIRSGYPLQSFLHTLPTIKNNKTQAKKGFLRLSLLQALDTRKWISHGIEVANNSPITDKFNLGVIQV